MIGMERTWRAILVGIFFFTLFSMLVQSEPVDPVIVEEGDYGMRITVIQNETDDNGDGLPDIVSSFYVVSGNTLEAYVNQTTGAGGYKWKAAICNVTAIYDVGKWEYNPATEVWTYTGLLNYAYLLDYGYSSDWCSETGGYGFVLFGAGSGEIPN